MTYPKDAPSLEKMLKVADEAGDQQTAEEIMLLLFVASQAEAIELHEAMSHGEYPRWLYEEALV